MAVNKVIINTSYGEEVLIDLTKDTVTPETLLKGVTAHSASGQLIVGTLEIAPKYTNLVPTSTDTDGSVYNGVGYKENVRLSSGGGVSGSAQAGSVTTGFMPFTYQKPLIVRMKGATWLGESANTSGTHWYFNVYNSSKSFAGGFPDSGLSSYSHLVKVSYDASTDVTTFDFTQADGSTAALAQALKAGGYIRINAKGKGANLIVTVNEEIK